MKGGNEVNPDNSGDARIAIVRLTTAESKQIGGELVSFESRALAIRIPDEATFEPSEPLAVVRGEVGARVVARARYLRSVGRVAIFRLSTDFSPFDARRDPRLPVHLPVQLLWRDARQPGIMTDVSHGGLAVAAKAAPQGSELTVMASSNGFWSTLPCRLVGSSAEGPCTMLHLQFRELNMAERAFVRQMIRDAQRMLELRAA